MSSPINPFFEESRVLAKQIEGALERAMLWDQAIGMAYSERTGQDLGPGEAYSAFDAVRAVQIMDLYPTTG